MSYTGFITRVNNIRPAENADKLNLCDVFGNTVVVDKSVNENDLYVYFPCDGQLSLDFCLNNNLLRKLPDGTPGTGYMDPDKRNVVAIKLRGNKSDGLVLPLSCLDYCFEDGAAAHLKIGDTIDVVNGHDICTKYIPRGNKSVGRPTDGNKTRKKKIPTAPLFVEHADTEQLAYNLGAFQSGDQIEITLKMHGTSQRTGYLPIFKGWKTKNKFFQGIVNKYALSPNLSSFARKCVDIAMRDATPIYDWGYVTGTRRTVLNSFDGGFYGSNEFREQYHKFFEGKLWKGEEIFYEVVGFTHTGAPIMSIADNKKLNDKEFVKQYGKTTTFSYGCSPTGEGEPENYWDEEKTEPCMVPILPQSDIYVYRMTMTNEDGNIVEYTPDFMRYRCEQMGVKTVPVFWKGIIPENPASVDDSTIDPGEWIKNVAERFYDGPDPIGKTHVREGVVVRIINKPKFCAYKHKNWYFKALEGIIKVEADAPDMEEADGLTE